MAVCWSQTMGKTRLRLKKINAYKNRIYSVSNKCSLDHFYGSNGDVLLFTFTSDNVILFNNYFYSFKNGC